MNKLLRIIIQLLFFVWLANFMLPSALGTFRPIGWILTMGTYLMGILLALAVVAVVIPIIQRRRTIAKPYKIDTLILHDLPNQAAETLLGSVANHSGTVIYSAIKTVAICKGCYDCWLKSPGICSMHDGIHEIGSQISNARRFIIISKSRYGGFSTEIKRCLDRFIPCVLPFFDVRGNELHHQVRCPNKGGKFLTYIYNGNELSQDERDSISKIAKANGLNMDRSICDTVICGNESNLAEVLA